MNTKITNGNYFCLKDIENYLISNKELLGSKVLDFGCGDSPYYELLKPINYTGVDLEINKSISTYKNLLKIEKNKTLPFENSKFDSIIATQVIYQIESLDKLIIDFHRILNKKGLVLVTVPFMWFEVYDNMHPNKRFSKNELHDIFKKEGFEYLTFDFVYKVMIFDDSLIESISSITIILFFSSFSSKYPMASINP